MSSDAARDLAGEVLAGLRDQLADIARVQKKQAALLVNAGAADGAVELTVNARGQLVNVVIDESYLDDHEFDELPGHILEAAQTAARDAAGQVEEMLAPINERHQKFPKLSDIAEGLLDPSDLVPLGFDVFTSAVPGQGDSSATSTNGDYDHDDGYGGFPKVKR